MLYEDRVYGKFTISEPVIIELIESPAVQRLQKIDQAGYSSPFFPNTFHSRFEHSMGVLYLLQKYKAPLEEQIAGLLHDVSHSTFSHTIDFIKGTGNEQNYQDSIFPNFVKQTTIPSILEKHHIPLSHIINEKNFPLQEKPLPSLCADRIDYSLRSSVMFQEITPADVSLILDKLQVHEKDWFFSSKDIGFFYAYLFSFINTTYYSSFISAVMYQTTADCLKYALEKGYCNVQDLYTTDDEILQKIQPFLPKDPHLQLLFDRMNNKIPVVNNPELFDKKVTIKSRVVDPLCLHENNITPLSHLYPEWKSVLETESRPKTYFLQFAH